MEREHCESLFRRLLRWTEKLVYSVHGERPQLEFEWDPKKAERNLRAHGVELVDAVTVFDDDRAITLFDEHPKEERAI